MTPSLKAALEDVDQLGNLAYPTGMDRARLCHAAVELARAVRPQAEQIAALEAKLEEANKRVAELELLLFTRPEITDKDKAIEIQAAGIMERQGRLDDASKALVVVGRERDEARAVARRLKGALEIQIAGACNRSTCNGRGCCDEMDAATEAKDKALRELPSWLTDSEEKKP